MTSLSRKLVLSAVLAASLPAAALAHEHDEDCDHRAPPPAAYVPPPAYGPAVVAYPAPPAAAEWRGEGHGRWWRERAWREREIAHVRFELRALDARRAEALARFGGNPWRMARFDRWYGFRRAELERRLDELQPVAWR
jgi:hypothetical protein